MRTYVLVHGAWHGGWCWKYVAQALCAAGHRVYTPSLTGLGDRKHLIGPAVTIDTHIDDILNLLEADEMSEVCLVGHSYGAQCASVVADRNPSALARLVLIDGGWPENGKSIFDLMPPETVRDRLDAAQRSSNGVSIPPPPPSAFGVTDPQQGAWMERRLTPQPLGTYRQPVRFLNEPGNGRPVTYIRCTDPVYPFAEPFARYAATQAGWEILEIPTGHDVMITRPAELSRMLLQLA